MMFILKVIGVLVILALVVLLWRVLLCIALGVGLLYWWFAPKKKKELML